MKVKKGVFMSQTIIDHVINDGQTEAALREDGFELCTRPIGLCAEGPDWDREESIPNANGNGVHKFYWKGDHVYYWDPSRDGMFELVDPSFYENFADLVPGVKPPEIKAEKSAPHRRAKKHKGITPWG